MENWLKASSLVSKSFRSFTFKSSQLSFQSTWTSWRHWAPGHGTPNTVKVRANWRNSATPKKPEPVWILILYEHDWTCSIWNHKWIHLAHSPGTPRGSSPGVGSYQGGFARHSWCWMNAPPNGQGPMTRTLLLQVFSRRGLPNKSNSGHVCCHPFSGQHVIFLWPSSCQSI